MSTLRWHGGKTHLAYELRQLFPGTYRRYREPFFGGGSILFSGDGMDVDEKVNDIYGDLINFWRVLRSDEQWLKFVEYCQKTPFGKPSFDEAVVFIGTGIINCETMTLTVDDKCPIHRAWAFFVRNRISRQGLGKDFATPTTRLRGRMNENVSAWLSAVEGLEEIHYRLKRVEICQGDAIEFILKNDDKDTFFYVDPPYLDSTRSSKDEYVFEYSDNNHKQLLNVLSMIQGTFMLSGYGNTLYRMYAEKNKWNMNTFETVSHAGSGPKKAKRTECIWRNY